ncbi:MAG: SHOCT domain-containing protein [Anaerolineae bacterium]
MMLGMLLFWVLLAVTAVWLAGALFPGIRRTQVGPRQYRDPVEQASERYALGQISREEYLQLRADLGR